MRQEAPDQIRRRDVDHRRIPRPGRGQLRGGQAAHEQRGGEADQEGAVRARGEERLARSSRTSRPACCRAGSDGSTARRVTSGRTASTDRRRRRPERRRRRGRRRGAAGPPVRRPPAPPVPRARRPDWPQGPRATRAHGSRGSCRPRRHGARLRVDRPGELHRQRLCTVTRSKEIGSVTRLSTGKYCITAFTSAASSSPPTPRGCTGTASPRSTARCSTVPAARATSS